MFSRPLDSTSDEEIHDVFKWAMAHVSSYNWHLNGEVFFLSVRMATPFDISDSLHAHMKQLIIWASLKGEKMPANEMKFSEENQEENILGKRQ